MSEQIQLFIFPYAGGSIASFKRLADQIDKSIETVTIEYAGRGSRAKEPLAESIEDLLEDAIRFCQTHRDVRIPYAVMGYSMGSVLAYEMLARKLLPGELRHLFIAAEVSPKDRSLELRKVENPTEKRILERARKLGGLDECMLQNRRFADIYLRPMLSDYRLFFDYRFGGYEEKIKTDTTFFYCEKDTALEDVKKWSELIDGVFDYHELGQNHFFINQHSGEMAKIINETLCSKMR